MKFSIKNNTIVSKLQFDSLKFNKSYAIKLTAIIFVLSVAAYGIYNLGYNSGKNSIFKNASEVSKPSLPAAGKIESITSSMIKIRLPGNVMKEAKIDPSTQISDKNGGIEVGDVKVGRGATLFTKKSGDDIVATRILIQ